MNSACQTLSIFPSLFFPFLPSVCPFVWSHTCGTRSADGRHQYWPETPAGWLYERHPPLAARLNSHTSSSLYHLPVYTHKYTRDFHYRHEMTDINQHHTVNHLYFMYCINIGKLLGKEIVFLMFFFFFKSCFLKTGEKHECLFLKWIHCVRVFLWLEWHIVLYM